MAESNAHMGDATSQAQGGLTFSLLRRVILRHWATAPFTTAALVLLIAVGVASFVSIRLANQAALQSFSHFTELVSGASDFTVTHAGGRFTHEELRAVRHALGTQAVHLVPVIETRAPEAIEKQNDARAFTLLGVDLVALANLDVRAAAEGTSSETFALWREARGEPVAWVSPALKAAHPNGVDLWLGGRKVNIAFAGLLPTTAGGASTPDNLLLLDLPALQALLQREGEVDRVEGIVDEGADRLARIGAARAALLAGGEGRWALSTPDSRRDSASTMSAAFRLNLTVLSLLALLVGLTLIRQTLEAAVVRRRAEMATLRALGVEPRLLRRLWISEAALLGFLGGSAGVLLGWAGAQLTVQAVGQTVNALYFRTTASAASLHWPEAILGIFAGVAACVAAGWRPAREAAKTPPAQLLAHRGSAAPAGSRIRNSTTGFLLLAVSTVLAFAPGLPLASGAKFPLGGYAAAFLSIYACSLLASPLLSLAGRLLKRRIEAGAPRRIAASYLERPSSRHGIAAAGLVCAIAMTAGMAILVASFERSVRGWIDQSLIADLYVTPTANTIEGQRRLLPPEMLTRIAGLRGVDHIETQTHLPLILDGKPTGLVAAALDQQRFTNRLLWRQGQPVAPEGAIEAWVSESFASRFDCDAGARLTLPSPTGAVPVVVTAVYSDYGNERGSLWIDSPVLERFWGLRGATHVAVFVEAPTALPAVREAIAALEPGLSFFENQALRAEVLRVFRQTFSITYALEILGVGVALSGLALTLASLTLERRSELTTLRAIGFSRAELASLAAWEGGVLAAVGAALGLLLSLGLGWILVFIVNKQSFGWTLQWNLPLPGLLVLWLGVVACGVLAARFIGARSAGLAADRED
ncbi:FtsX-like permease family protein [Nibricoccus sp. IMCC34717]|uniref:FtsX-like permease family protein n=1 Tax=Nibricoccus sp. IMCC34717 TaxID=3034021 RepID=UPI00384E6B06